MGPKFAMSGQKHFLPFFPLQERGTQGDFENPPPPSFSKGGGKGKV